MTATGLTAERAAQRLASEGPNELPVEAPTTTAQAVLHQLRDTVIVVLLVAATLTALVGDLIDTAVILAVVVLNTILGAVQEVRSGRAVAALAALTAPQATVVRGGVAVDVKSREVTRGDLLRLAAGDIVAADARLVQSESLAADESTLTGESDPVSKSVSDTLYAGTVITRGRGDALVEAIGETSAIGGIAKSLKDARSVQTPLQRQLATLGRRLAVAASLAAVVVAVLNLILGKGLESSVVLAISLAVAAIPESLPAVVSVSLAMAARRMGEHGVLARKLAAVEALGSVTVIASDKTGTLTVGQMSVTDTWEPASAHPQPVSLLEAAALCNDACSGPDGAVSHRDDPTEIALVEAASAAGTDVVALRARLLRVAEVPFDATTAQMTTTHRAGDGATFEIRKGAPESVLPSIAVAQRVEAKALALQWTAQGRRLLAVASRKSGASWELLGLISLADPPRAAARAVISAFRTSGIRPVMITGDHPATASAIGVAVGLSKADTDVGTAAQCLDGGDYDVYARILPDQKTSIVDELRNRGAVVAMTGDGVNDAPALRAADIGVAMGKRGTEVAKQAADLVLVEDDLSAMVPAIAEGRRVYDNLRRFLHYALGGGVAEVLLMILGPFFGLGIPLLAGQILWVNLLTHGLPGVAMGNEPADPDVLTRPPRPPTEQLMNRTTALRVGVLATVIAAVSIAVGVVTNQSDGPWQSSIFITLSCAQLAVAIALRPTGALGHNLLLPAAVLLNVALTVLAVTWGPLMEVLRLERLSAGEWAVCIAAALIPAAVARIQVRRRPRR